MDWRPSFYWPEFWPSHRHNPPRLPAPSATARPAAAPKPHSTRHSRAAGWWTFNCGPAPHTIPLTTEKSLSIDTQVDGGGLITLDGQDQTRIFYVPSGVTLDLSNITLTRGNGEGTVTPDWGGAIQIDGGTATITNSLLTANSVGDYDDGGAIYVRAGGELTVIASTLTDNVGGRGGAIFAEGATATVIDSVIDGNTSAENGGGIYARNIVTISGTTISNNEAGFTRGGDGGGIYNQADLTVTDSTISGNEAEDDGGGIYDSGGGSMTISGTTIHDNHVGEVSADGGGIRSNSPLILIDSTISDNTADDDGAGLYIVSSTATITGSTFSGNHAIGGRGGGIRNSGTTVLTDSTVSGNQSGRGAGGIYNNSALTIINSTISGNQANEDGGGIYNTSNTLAVTNSTISDNSAGLQGDGIRFSSGTLTFQNTIIANGPDDNCYSFFGDQLGSLGGNLSDDDTCGFSEPSDLNDIEADLGPLADNGGPTQTHLPQTGSPAIDHTACVVATDQRGIDRPQGAACDIGSVEVLVAEHAAALCQQLYRRGLQPPERSMRAAPAGADGHHWHALHQPLHRPGPLPRNGIVHAASRDPSDAG